MISDHHMKLLKSEGDVSYYLFKPTVFCMYYDDNKQEKWPVHQKAITHRLHMLFYLLRGGYRILYMTVGDDVASYIVYNRAGRSVVRGTTRKDIYSIFIWTYPEYRKRGYANQLLREMLHMVPFEMSYKTIMSDNICSIKTAEANGYRRLFPVKRTKLLHTAYHVKENAYHLYGVNKKDLL